MYHETKTIAIIDLGTNTFHMVIFSKNNQNEVVEKYRKRHQVFLSQDGIKTIAPSSIERAKKAILDFQKTLETLKPDHLRAIGTEALRMASNGPSLAKYIENIISTKVEIISGEREAELIAKGVIWQFQAPLKSALIMDIGGGSIEFIHLDNNKIMWLGSYPLGVGVLYNKYKHHEPISLSEIKKIHQFLADSTSDMMEYLKNIQINTLIGASGSFELIPAIKEGLYPPVISNPKISVEDFLDIKQRIITSSLTERLKIKGLPPVRAQLIVVAFIIMDWFIKKTSPSSLLISKYAVKEGLASEELEKPFDRPS